LLFDLEGFEPFRQVRPPFLVDVARLEDSPAGLARATKSPVTLD
jgi:hypothetical protein